MRRIGGSGNDKQAALSQRLTDDPAQLEARRDGVLKTAAQHESLVDHGPQRHLLNGENGSRPLHEKRAVCLTKKLVLALRMMGYSSS